MKAYQPDQIRNIALVGHGHAGKTMLVEALMFAAGQTTRMGKVEDGTTHTDFEPEEHKHQISVSLSVAPVEYDGFKLNLIDCPGYADFVGESAGALRIADACVFVVSAVDGVQVQTELMWHKAQELGLPCLIVINKLDRERASFSTTFDQLREAFGNKPFAMHLPVGEERDFHGIIDLFSSRAFSYNQSDPCGSEDQIPSEWAQRVDDAHRLLVETAAESDDTLLERYFEIGDLQIDEIARGLHEAVRVGTNTPVLACSATHLIGIDQVAKAMCTLCPSPLERAAITGTGKDGSDVLRKPDPSEPVSAFVFKTIADPFVGKISVFRVFSGEIRPDLEAHNSTRGHNERLHQLFHMSGKDHVPASKIVCGDIGAVAKLNDTHTGDTLSDDPSIIFPAIEFPVPVLSVAVAPTAHGEEEKLTTALQRLIEEDPVLQVERNSETHQTVLSGLGESHLQIVFERVQRKFGIDVEQHPLRIPYRETVQGSADHQSKYVKQSGGRGQFAVAHLKVEPLPAGGGYEFVNKVVGGSIPGNYIPAVDKGVRTAMSEGVLAGYPVVDVRVTVDDGKFHTVDSSDMAFQICASIGFREAVRKAGPVLLEPMMEVQIRVPDSMLGDIMGDLNSKRGRILGTEPDGRGYQILTAQAPMAEMARFAIDLRSITGGRGTFTMHFDHYDQVPTHLQERIVSESSPQPQHAGKH